jgi:hypothetical protein
MEVAARWWRTGDETEITRMGSPLCFWKLQQVPVLWLLDRIGHRDFIDDPVLHQAELLPLIRAGALWVWMTAIALTAWWSKCLYGPRAMAFSAWLFALSPNLIAHGGLVTMELPLIAATTAMLFLFWKFLVSGASVWFWASAAVGGLAFSCKYTTLLVPPILAVVWLTGRGRRSGFSRVSVFRHARQVALGMFMYVLVMLLANALVTGLAVMPLSHSQGDHPSIPTRFGDRVAHWITAGYETPIPQDWVGLATQIHHQMSGGASYLLGERRMSGWRHYFFVTLAVKVPLAFWLLLAGRAALLRRDISKPDSAWPREEMLLQTMALFLAITAVGSSRNYGFRYLLPLAPLAIIWISSLAERIESRRTIGWSWHGWLVALGLVGQVWAIASVHPYELTYFNMIAGGPLGGRHILSDSNLDWGQGLTSLARLQRREPAFRDLTLYYFGDTDPAYSGVQGIAHVVNAVDENDQLPDLSTVRTRYLGVSASLQWGPWGPPGFFRVLNRITPARFSDDTTIAIYRTADLNRIALRPGS